MAIYGVAMSLRNGEIDRDITMMTLLPSISRFASSDESLWAALLSGCFISQIGDVDIGFPIPDWWDVGCPLPTLDMTVAAWKDACRATHVRLRKNVVPAEFSAVLTRMLRSLDTSISQSEHYITFIAGAKAKALALFEKLKVVVAIKEWGKEEVPLVGRT